MNHPYLFTAVETNPLDMNLMVHVPQAPTTLTAEALAGLTDAQAATLLRVADDPDNTRCEANSCKNPVGFVLYESDDGIGSGMSWHWTSLVIRPDGTVIAVCEDDSPDTVYGP